MRIGVPVKDKNLILFKNAGHAPYFAIFELSGNGMFKTFKFVEFRDNPRVNLDAEEGCMEHNHDFACEEEERAHAEEHNVLGEILHDCEKVMVLRACKNMAKSLKDRGIVIEKVENNFLSGVRI